MSHPARPFRFALAALVSLAACVPAQAQMRLSATAANLRYTLVDLDPADGIAPSISFLSPEQVSLSNHLTAVQYGKPTVDWSSAPYVTGPTTVRHDLDPLAHSAVSWDGQDFSATATTAPISVGELSVTAVGGSTRFFSLSPHTGITFSGDVTVDLVLDAGPGGNASAYGDAGFDLAYTRPETPYMWEYIRDDVGGNINNKPWASFNDALHLSETVAVSWNNDGADWRQASLYLGAGFSASEYGTPVWAVPEPGEWAMLSVGVGLLGWRARRKRHTA